MNLAFLSPLSSPSKLSLNWENLLLELWFEAPVEFLNRGIPKQLEMWKSFQKKNLGSGKKKKKKLKIETFDETCRDSNWVGLGGAWESATQQGPKPLPWKDSNQQATRCARQRARAQLAQGARVGFANSVTLPTLPLLPLPSPQQNHLLWLHWDHYAKCETYKLCSFRRGGKKIWKARTGSRKKLAEFLNLEQERS